MPTIDPEISIQPDNIIQPGKDHSAADQVIHQPINEALNQMGMSGVNTQPAQAHTPITPEIFDQVVQKPVQENQVVELADGQKETRSEIAENIAAWNPISAKSVVRDMENHTKNNDGAGDIARKRREALVGPNEELKEAA